MDIRNASLKYLKIIQINKFCQGERIYFHRMQLCMKYFCFPFQKESTPWGAHFFLLEYTLLQKGLPIQNSKQGITNIFSLWKMIEIYTVYPFLWKTIAESGLYSLSATEKLDKAQGQQC